MAMTSTFTDELSLGERLARARKATGLGQREFSKAVGLSARSVAAYELDDRHPSFETVVRWAALTGAPVDYFAAAIPGGDAPVNRDHHLAVIEGGRVDPLPGQVALPLYAAAA